MHKWLGTIKLVSIMQSDYLSTKKVIPRCDIGRNFDATEHTSISNQIINAPLPP